MYSIMKIFWLLILINISSFLKADEISVQFLNDQIENKIIPSERDEQLGTIGKLGKKMVWLGGFGLVSTVLIEMDDDSDVGYIDPMENNNNVDSNTYSILKIVSLGISASGLVLYFFDGGSFDDLVKPPTIDFYQLNLNANSIN